jgi:hypothetical protein
MYIFCFLKVHSVRSESPKKRKKNKVSKDKNKKINIVVNILPFHILRLCLFAKILFAERDPKLSLKK